MNKFGLSFLFACFLLLPTAAQEGYSLQDCLRYARSHSRINKVQELTLKNNKLSRSQAMAQFLPYVSAGTGGSLSFGRGVDPETNTYTTNKYLSNSYSASLSMPIFEGLVNVNNVRMMNAIVKREKENVKIQENKVSMAVINAFYSCLYYQKTVAQTQVQLQGDEETLRSTRIEEEQGTKAGVDVAQTEANVASDRFTLIQQQNLYDAALLDLKNNMSFPIDSTLAIEENLDEVLPVMPLDEESARDIYSRASFYLPEALAASYSLKSTKYELYKANGQYAPSISFSAGISTSYFVNLDNRDAYDTFNKQFNDNIGKYISVNMSIPIFTRFSRIISHKQAKVNYIAQQYTYAQTMDDLEKDVIQAVMDVEGSVKEYEAAVKKVDAVTLAHRANERKFQMGALSALDYYTSLSQLARSQAQCIGKKVQYLIKKMQLDYYKGEPFIKELP